MVAHAYKSQHFGRLRWVDHRSGVQGQLANMVNPISTNNTKISRLWWHAPVVPVTWEAEAGKLLEPRRQRLHHCPLAWATRVKLHLKKKKPTNQPTKQNPQK